VKRNMSSGLLLAVVCWAGVALGQEPSPQARPAQVQGRGQGWSVLAAQTVGSGNTVLHGQAGWPGLSFGVLHGATNRFDLGGRFTFNYGEEGIVRRVVPGLKLQAWMRLMLLDTQRVGLALSFAPGPLFYFRQYDTRVGLTLPVNLTLGIPVGSALMLNAGLDFPFYVTFGTGGGPVFPILMGGGLEYFISRNLAATFNVRMGPSIFPDDDFRRRQPALFTMDALFGISYRL
jgi:hypothetical protein